MEHGTRSTETGERTPLPTPDGVFQTASKSISVSGRRTPDNETLTKSKISKVSNRGKLCVKNHRLSEPRGIPKMSDVRDKGIMEY